MFGVQLETSKAYKSLSTILCSLFTQMCKLKTEKGLVSVNFGFCHLKNEVKAKKIADTFFKCH